MIEQLRPYLDRKKSGADWLGDVPKGWHVKPGFAAFREKHTKNLGLQEKRVLSLSYGRIIVKPVEKLRGLVPESFETYQIVGPGDIIVRSTDLQNDRTSLRIGLVRDRGIITSAYICLAVTDAMMPEFGYQLLNAYDLMKVLYGYGSGLRQNLEWADFKRIPVLLPPLEEQALIVRFLDHVTGKIDRAIRAKRRVIALLNEQKQTIIHRAVTRGFDPNATLKDSGVPWLGQIPAHWQVRRLGRSIDLLTGFPFPSANFSTSGTDVRLLRGINVTPTGLRWSSTVYWRRRPGDGLDDFELKVNDIILGMDRPVIGGGVRVARVGTCDVPSLLLQRVARIRARDDLMSEYAMTLLSGRLFANYMEPIFTGISVPHLSPTQIKNFTVPVPPASEQHQILRNIAQETAKGTVLLERTEREIVLLREYRTRLVADVVTGKLDVRAVAARLPVDAKIEPLAPDDLANSSLEDEDELLAEEAA